MVKLYKVNIYGIIGTLIFHILLVGVFLTVEINRRTEIVENAMMVEIPVELLNEKLAEEINQGNALQANEPSARDNTPPDITNIPSNRGLQTKNPPQRDRFFDEDYQKEVEAARKLASDVDKQLNKKAVSIDDIPMPVQVTDGMSKDEIKNVIYTGKSNIEYHLGNRYHLRLPVPVYLAHGGGVVDVDISVDREGKVIAAKPRETGSGEYADMILYARTAAERTFFNRDPAAPAVQNGTIRYTYIAQ